MEASNGDPVNPPEPEGPSQPQLRRVASAEFKRPSLDLLDDTMEARTSFLDLCVPLYKYALEGNWDKAKPMLLDHNRMLLNSAIAQGWPTVLHVAAGAGYFPFVKELVKLMEESGIGLDLQDCMGNTAFCFAVLSGNLDIVQLMLEKNPMLPRIRGRKGFTPLLFAALQGRADMAKYLYSYTKDNFDEADWNKLFLTCIESGIYDLALTMLEERTELAFAMDGDGTGLHIMARRKTEDLGSYKNNQLTNSGTKKHGVALELVRMLWGKILRGVDSKSNLRRIINEPSRLLFDAAKVGNFDFLSELMKSYHDLIWEFDNKGQSIIQIAVLHRHPDIFSLIHDINGSKDVILSHVDKDDGNNILHLAAKLAPADRLEFISGAAFQMKFELLWFEEVRKIVLPSYVNMKNNNDETPRALFTNEHATLRKDAESWMKGTAKSCMLVSTLVTTGVFTAAFSIPGGINDDSATPNYLKKPSFMIFAISDAIAMISSSASVVAFLSILISRYAEDDFYKSLPSKLIFGLITLFVSITSMMVAFSSAFFVTYDHGRGLKWVPSFISVLSLLPIAIFLIFKFRLFYDIIYSTYYLNTLFKPTKHMLY